MTLTKKERLVIFIRYRSIQILIVLFLVKDVLVPFIKVSGWIIGWFLIILGPTPDLWLVYLSLSRDILFLQYNWKRSLCYLYWNRFPIRWTKFRLHNSWPKEYLNVMKLTDIGTNLNQSNWRLAKHGNMSSQAIQYFGTAQTL